MGIVDRIKSIFRKEPKVSQLGEIYLKPSERTAAQPLAQKTGVTVSIPETKEVFHKQTRSGSGSVSGPSGPSGPAPTPLLKGSTDEYQGPTRPTTDVQQFRETGISQPTTQELLSKRLTQALQAPPGPSQLLHPPTTPTPTRELLSRGLQTALQSPQRPSQSFDPKHPTSAPYQGPTRPTTDVQQFRETGISKQSPYITQVQTDEIKGTPITKTVYIDPEGQWSRLASEEEKRYYEEARDSAINASLANFPNTPQGRADAAAFLEDQKKVTIGKLLGRFKQKASSFASKEIVDEEWLKQGVRWNMRKYLESSNPMFRYLPPNVQEEMIDRATGYGMGIAPTTVGDFVLAAGTFGTGQLLKTGIKAGGVALSKIPKYGKAATTTWKAGEVVAGAGLGSYFVYQTGAEAKAAPTPEAQMEVLGEATREALAFGYGYSKGGKVFDIARGKWVTRGRTEIPIERLVPADVLAGKKTFPEAPKSQHLQLFESTAKKYPELGEGAGAFHSTGTRFWDGKLQPGPGTSEIAGLYGATDLSPYFLRLGKGVSKFYYKPKDIWRYAKQDEGTPGIAYLMPEGFRTGKWGGVYRKPLQAYWKEPARPGIAEVPRAKTETEAVFRPEAGAYEFVGGKYYTTFQGVRIPIDVFKYGAKRVKGPSLKGPELKVRGLMRGYYKGMPRRGPSLYFGKSSYKGPLSSVKGLSYKFPSSYKIRAPYSLVTSRKPVSRYKPRVSSKKISRRMPRSSYVPRKSYKSVSSRIPRKSYRPSYSYKPRTTYTSPYVLKRIKPTKTKKKVRGKVKGENYIGEIRRFGKWRPVYKGKKREVIIERTKQKIRKELGASLRVKGPSGKYLMLQPTKQFRRSKSKATPHILIERSKFRLDSPKELGEIKYHRRRAPPKKKRTKRNLFFR